MAYAFGAVRCQRDARRRLLRRGAGGAAGCRMLQRRAAAGGGQRPRIDGDPESVSEPCEVIEDADYVRDLEAVLVEDHIEGVLPDVAYACAEGGVGWWLSRPRSRQRRRADAIRVTPGNSIPRGVR